MILEMDAGNTRLKWRILDSAGRTENVGVHSGAVDNLSMLPDLRGVRRARICSVRSEQANAVLAGLVQSAIGVIPEFAKSERACGGVVNGYTEFEKLGADRWMAILAGRNLVGEQSYAVLDAGSAITLDIVDQRGFHRGGYIVPGVQLQVQGLLRGTAMGFGSHIVSGDMELGRNTEAAIRNGIFSMICRWVVAELDASNLAIERVLVTGGDAPAVFMGLTILGRSPDDLPELVLDGLRISLP